MRRRKDNEGVNKLIDRLVSRTHAVRSTYLGIWFVPNVRKSKMSSFSILLSALIHSPTESAGDSRLEQPANGFSSTNEDLTGPRREKTHVCGTYFPAGNNLLPSSSLTTHSALFANIALRAIHESGFANNLAAAPFIPIEYPTGLPEA